MARITVGVPVFNGGEMLAESLECLVSQTLDDLEILIGDNASDDQTAEICAEFSVRDPRIRVIRRRENIGALGNFGDLLYQASAPMFLWRAYDDLSDAAYIETLAAALRSAPNAVLAAPHVETLRLETGKRRPRTVRGLQASCPAPHRVLAGSQAGWIYGLWRTDHLRDAFDWAVPVLHPDIWGWDHLALFPAIAAGRVAFADEARLTLRLNRSIEKEQLSDDKLHRRDLANRYRAACLEVIERADGGRYRKLRLRLALERHINRRIAPILKRL